MGSTVVRTHLYIHFPDTPLAHRVEAYSLQCLNIWTPPSTPKPDVARIYEDLPLADPNFTTSGGVDLVIGANSYPSILLPGLIRHEGFLHNGRSSAG